MPVFLFNRLFIFGNPLVKKVWMAKASNGEKHTLLAGICQQEPMVSRASDTLNPVNGMSFLVACGGWPASGEALDLPGG
jgi:hypothetical protein